MSSARTLQENSTPKKLSRRENDLISIKTLLPQYVDGVTYFTLPGVSKFFQSMIEEFEKTYKYKSAEFQQALIQTLLNEKIPKINTKILEINKRLMSNYFGKHYRKYTIPPFDLTTTNINIRDAFNSHMASWKGSIVNEIIFLKDSTKQTSSYSSDPAPCTQSDCLEFSKPVGFVLALIGMAICIYGIADKNMGAAIGGGAVALCIFIALFCAQTRLDNIVELEEKRCDVLNKNKEILSNFINSPELSISECLKKKFPLEKKFPQRFGLLAPPAPVQDEKNQQGEVRVDIEPAVLLAATP